MRIVRNIFGLENENRKKFMAFDGLDEDFRLSHAGI